MIRRLCTIIKSHPQRESQCGVHSVFPVTFQAASRCISTIPSGRCATSVRKRAQPQANPLLFRPGRREHPSALLRPHPAGKDTMNDRLKCKIGPSILNSDLSQLYKESQRLLDNGADYLHLDVMDGHFVPNLTFGAPVVKCLRSKVRHAFFETHMMVQNPEQWIEPMADAGVDQYTFHIEPVKEIIKTCRKVRDAGMKVGLALKPGTQIDAVRQFIDQADMILIMTVEPGFGGQKFLNDMMPKVQWLRHNYPLLDVEVDGGVGLNTIAACADAGANMIVSGTAIINAVDQRAVIASLRETVESSIHKCSV